MSKLCYEVMIHEMGKPSYMDRCVSADTCLTKEQAVQITAECHRRTRDIPVKYYWRIRDGYISK